jgi:DNA-binding Xre family transcriptional regulator
MMLVMPNQIDRYTWTQEMADRLRSARGKMPRAELVRRLKCGTDQIRKLEKVQHKSISVVLLNAICEKLGISSQYIIYGENDNE